MNINDVPVKCEGARGCGYRKGGGLYLIGPELSNPCGKLPIILERCPTCGEGIGPSRAPKWIEPSKLISEAPCSADGCQLCPAAHPAILGERAVLIWIGEAHYSTPADFTREAAVMGVSRRIKSVPKGFEVGKTWVVLAHPKVSQSICHCLSVRGGVEFTDDDCPDCEGEGKRQRGGIFTLFRPSAIEYVCRGDETEEELDKVVKRGLSPVRVTRVGSILPGIE